MNDLALLSCQNIKYDIQKKHLKLNETWIFKLDFIQ